MKTFLNLVLLLILTACSSSTHQRPPIIPLKDFFDNPKISSAKISPDGKKYAFLAPEKDRLNIWVCDLSEPFNRAKLITHEEKRGIFRFFWTRDSRYVIYAQDQGGNENYHLYRVDPCSSNPTATDLTPFEKNRAGVIDLPRENPDIMLITLNQRDPHYFDAYRLKISDGTLELLEKNPGDVDEWLADHHGNIRACIGQVGTTKEIRVRDKNADAFHKLATYADEEDIVVYDFDKEESFLYVGSAKNTNTSHLAKLDLKTGQETIIDQDPEYDLDSPIISDLTHELLGVAYNRERLTYKPYDSQFAKNLQILGKIHDGEIIIRSTDDQEKLWIIAYNSPIDPGATYLYNQNTGETKFLYRPRPWLNSKWLVGMQPISYTSRDGLTIHGYLTVPKGVDAKNLSMVLVVHGGPWARDNWGYDPEAQFLANRGYAVLQVNYRGSTGYGKKFLHAGDKQWGAKMLDDLIDGVNWAGAQHIANPRRLAIYGGSYGGYATLAALAFEPKVFKCGIDYVGISNLLTFMNTIPPYWETFRDTMYQRIGNPQTETEMLRERSPLFSTDKIQAPLFIAQGYNDPRVNHAEAEQIVQTLKKDRKTVEYLVKMDEGHGFANPENRLEFYRTMEAFLKKNL
ncbi:MAG: S9 family peptidase [Verrucomicrobiota bacterium]